MRFEKLQLARYGHFTDFCIDFGKRKPGTSDLHVLYGPNEAGKSTTLAAITDLLFGFPHSTPWRFLHGNALLELEARLQQGEQSVGLKRFKNHLTNLSNDRLERFPLDLQGLSREDYELRFSFNEQTLQDGGDQILSSNGDVGQALFSASAGLANLDDLIKHSMEAADSFWQPRKTKGIRLKELKDELGALDERIRMIKLDANAFRKRVDAESSARARSEACRQQRSELQSSIALLERRGQAAGLAAKLVRQLEQRQALEDEGIIAMKHTAALRLDTGKQARESLEATRRQVEEYQRALTLQQEQLARQAELQEKLEQLKPDEAERRVLDAGKTLKKLSEETAAEYEWRQQRTDAQSIVDHCNRELAIYIDRLSLADESGLESRLPGEAALEEIGQRLEQEQRLTADARHAADELRKLTPLSEEETALVSAGEADMQDIDLLGDVLRRVRKEASSRELERQEAELLQDRQLLLARADALGLQVSSLATLDVPSDDWLAARLKELGEQRNACSHLQQQIDQLAEQISEKQQSCRRLLTDAGAVDPSNLSRALQTRDEAWESHVASIDAEDPHTRLQTSARRFQTLMHQHDNYLRSCIESSQESAELSLLQEQIADHQTDLDALKSVKLPGAESSIDEISRQILSRVSGFYSSAIIDGEELRQRHAEVQRVKQSRLACESQALKVENLQQQCSKDAQTILGLLATLSIKDESVSSGSLSLPDLVSHAERIEESIRAARTSANELRHRLIARQKEYALRTEASRDADRQLSRWQAGWDVLVADTVFGNMSSGQVRDTLQWIAAARPLLVQRRNAVGKIDTLDKRIATRDSAMARILAEIDCETLAQAETCLQQATRNADEYGRIEKQLRELTDKLTDGQLEREQHSRELETLREVLGVGSNEELLTLLARTENHRVCNDRCDELLEQLSDIMAEPFDEAAALQLNEACDAAAMATEMQDLQDRAREADEAYEEAYRQWTLAGHQLAQIDDGNEYAQLVQQRQNLLDQIRDMARRTAEARCGQLILKAAMARFRQQHQSVILSEAQKAFTTLTGGRYRQLLPRDEGGRGRQKLYAIDENSTARAVNELSTGTRYQLYLALRAAAYADYAAQRPPLPFVADDIMESFDDHRSAAAFRVLGEMARRGQVLYLTHHRHLLDIAQEVLGKDRVRIHHYPD